MKYFYVAQRDRPQLAGVAAAAKCRWLALVLAVVILLFAQSCPVQMQPRPRAILAEQPPWFAPQSAAAEFATQARVLARQQGIEAFIIERPSYTGSDAMKIAVIYPSPVGNGKTPLLRPIVIAPGFSAGASLYLGYACELAKRGFAVFLPDYKGDFVHFFGLELFRDPLVNTATPELAECVQGLIVDLAEHTGNEVDAQFAWEVWGKFWEGEIKDQAVADLIRKNFFAYRDYSLDATVCSVFDVAEDTDSPLYARLDTSTIGLEAHSLGADEVMQALLRRDGTPQYWWTDNIGVAILKGGTVFLHDEASVKTISTPVFFINGEYDDPSGIMEVTWSRFNMMDAPTGYFTLSNAGHMVFVDPPIGFFGDKLVPVFGQFSDVRWDEFLRNRAANVDISAMLYDAYLADDADALVKIHDGAIDFDGTYDTRNM